MSGRVVSELISHGYRFQGLGDVSVRSNNGTAYGREEIVSSSKASKESLKAKNGDLAAKTRHALRVGFSLCPLTLLPQGVKTSFNAEYEPPGRGPPEITKIRPATTAAPRPCRGVGMGAHVVHPSVAGS